MSSFAASQVKLLKLPQMPIKNKVLIVLTFLTKYLPMAIGILFCLIVVIGTIFYNALSKDIETTASITKTTMEKWRTGLFLANRFVEEINVSFGLPLLMIFGFLFFDFISNSYAFVLNIKSNSKTLIEYLFTMGIFIVKVIEFYLLVSIPSKQRNAVSAPD